MSQNDDPNRDRQNPREGVDDSNRDQAPRESRPGSPADDRGKQTDSTTGLDDSEDQDSDEMDDRDDDDRIDGGSNRRRNIS